MLKRNSKKILFLTFSLLLLFSIIVPFCAQAVESLENTYPSVPGQESITVSSGLPEYVKYIFSFAIAFSGILFFFILIKGGFLYYTSLGKPAQILEAKENLKSSILGIIILLSSYLILFTINPELVNLSFPPLNLFDNPLANHYIEVEPENASIISQSLPLGRSIKDGVWNQEYVNKTKEVLDNLENFLKQKITVNDPTLIKDQDLKGIADLNKYLSTLTHECQTSNLRAMTSTPQTGCLPVGCSGDPCQINQDSKIEEDSARARINKVKAINENIIKDLTSHQKLVNTQRDLLKEELRKFQGIESEISACITQNGQLSSLNQYLADTQANNDLGIKSVEISPYFSSQTSNLSFYCTGGGTIYDAPYNPNTPDPLEAEISDIDTGDYPSGIEEDILSCPKEIKVGETTDQLRELAILEIYQLDFISELTERLAKKTQEMTEFVSQCNESKAIINSGCIPNRCFGFCSPLPLPNCIPSCLSRCTQCIKGCSGEACPTQDIIATSEEIKEIENKLIIAIQQIKTLAPKITPLFNKLDGEGVAVGKCFSNDPLNPESLLLDCSSAKDNYGPDGTKIESCNPRNLFCCLFSSAPPVKSDTVSSISIKDFPILKTESNNCPKGWLCSEDVKYYNQYNKDASDPLKKLVSCMRAELDSVQKKKKTDNIIGKISAISDPNINKGLCDWILGPTKTGSCSYAYETSRGKEKVSAHYGGLYCKYDYKSYAVDIELSDDFQKEHLNDIIEATKKCSPESYLLYKSPQYLHIDLGGVNQCGSNE